MRDRRRGERGNALIEFALLATLMAVLLYGMIDICFLLGAKVTITHLSREAANALSRGSTMDETLAAIRNADDNLALDGPDGRVFVTLMSTNVDGDAFITGQQRMGALDVTSRVGTYGGPATPGQIPNGQLVAPNTPVSVVEIYARRRLFAGQLIGGIGSGGTIVLRAAGAF